MWGRIRSNIGWEDTAVKSGGPGSGSLGPSAASAAGWWGSPRPLQKGMAARLAFLSLEPRGWGVWTAEAFPPLPSSHSTDPVPSQGPNLSPKRMSPSSSPQMYSREVWGEGPGKGPQSQGVAAEREEEEGPGGRGRAGPVLQLPVNKSRCSQERRSGGGVGERESRGSLGCCGRVREDISPDAKPRGRAGIKMHSRGRPRT